jgi:hypothetical protein
MGHIRGYDLADDFINYEINYPDFINRNETIRANSNHYICNIEDKIMRGYVKTDIFMVN